MRILVCVKRVIEDSARLRLRSDGGGIDTASARYALNPFDERGLEAAVRLREAGVASEVVAATMGPAVCDEVLRSALAFGADRAIRITTEAEPEPVAVSRALAELSRREEPALALLGKQAPDDDAGQVGPMLAQRRGWPQATFASALSVEDEEVHVTREVDGGTRVVALRLPAVVTVELDLNEPRYLKLPSIMKAKRQTIESIPAADLGADEQPRTPLLELMEPPARPEGTRVGDVEELVDRLRNEAQVI